MSRSQTRMNRAEALRLARQGKLKGFSMSPRMLEETNVSDTGLEDLILAAGFLLVNELVEPEYAAEELLQYDADSAYSGQMDNTSSTSYESSSSYDSGGSDGGGGD